MLALILAGTGCGAGGDSALLTEKAAADPTFHRDIAPIVFTHCAPCHREGELAPFPLTTYDQVRRRGRQIAEVTVKRYMPPWKPEPGYGDFRDARALEPQEVDLLARWVATGMPRGGGEPPSLPAFPSGWRLGEPDRVIAFPEPYALSADGPDIFRNFVLPLEGLAGKSIDGFEFRPGAGSSGRNVIHHANTLADDSGTARQLDAREPGIGYSGMVGAVAPGGHFFGWTPGKTPAPLEEGAAWEVAPGTDLVVQLHLLPSGRPETVRPEIGLHLSERPPTRRPATLHLGSTAIDIPAGEQSHVIEDEYVLPVAVEAVAIYPHAHYLGRDLSIWAEPPATEDGEQTWLLRIRDWDFNWQDEYHYAQPVALVAGSRLRLRYTYDNSSGNPRNPNDPPKRTRWGPSTLDEMCDVWIKVYPKEKSELGALRLSTFEKDLGISLPGLRLRADEGGDPESLERYARALLALGRGSEALRYLDRASAAGPSDGGAWTVAFNRGLALDQLGRLEGALAAYSDAIRLAPNEAASHANQGGVLLRLGRHREAFDAYDRARDLDSRNPDVLSNLALAAQRLGRAEEALRILAASLEIDPDHAEARGNRGALFLQLGRVEEARFDLERALEARPRYAEAHKNLAALEAMTGRPEAAVSHLKAAIEIDDSDPEAWYRLALGLMQGEGTGSASGLDEARSAFERAIALAPDFAEAHFDFGNYLTVAQDPPAALGHFERAVELSSGLGGPAHRDALLGVGATLLELGRTLEATSHLEAAIALYPEDLDLRTTLARSLAIGSRLEEAERQLAWVLGKDPGNQAARELRRRIEQARGELR